MPVSRRGNWSVGCFRGLEADMRRNFGRRWIAAPVVAASIVVLWLHGTCLAQVGMPAALRAELLGWVDFSASPLGAYEDAQARREWPGLQWISLRNRAAIVADAEAVGGKCLRIAYPAGSVGPGQGGGQFRVKLPPREEYYLAYRLKFEDGFDFRRGGKLPGLCGGRANTGGNRPTGDGWSARYMWGRDGRMTVYLYHMGQRTQYGDGIALGVQLEPGRWYQLVQRIRVNTPERRDGQLQVWLDGREVLDRSDIRYRNVPGAMVDVFYFSTFHGGSSADWGPQRDSFARFDAFVIGTTFRAVAGPAAK